MCIDSRFTRFGYAAAGLIAGGVLVLAIGAQAATPSPSSTSSSSSADDPHPGDNGADGIPESQEHHGGHGGALDLSGEAKLSDLQVDDAVTFSVDDANVKQIDKLHAGDESKNVPQTSPSNSASSSNA